MSNIPDAGSFEREGGVSPPSMCLRGYKILSNQGIGKETHDISVLCRPPSRSDTLSGVRVRMDVVDPVYLFWFLSHWDIEIDDDWILATAAQHA